MTKDRINVGSMYLLRRRTVQIPVIVVTAMARGYTVRTAEGVELRIPTAASLSKHYDGCCLRGCGCQTMISDCFKPDTK